MLPKSAADVSGLHDCSDSLDGLWKNGHLSTVSYFYNNSTYILSCLIFLFSAMCTFCTIMSPFTTHLNTRTHAGQQHTPTHTRV